MSTQAEEQPITRPLAWIRQIPGDLFHQDDKPLLGLTPDFSWHDFASQLSQTLQLETCTCEHSEWQWRAKEELFNGLGEHLLGQCIEIAPIPGKIWWAMPEQTIKQLMLLLLAKQPLPMHEELDQDFLHAFYRFIAMEALNAFELVNSDKKLSPSLANKEELPNEHCLCMDITINIQQTTFHGRIFLSPEFRSAWKKRYLPQPYSLLASPMADTLDVMVHLEAGRVNLTLAEWNKIKTGDFLFLDNCSLDPDEDKGRVMLVINGIACFRARLKQGSLKILEHPLYHEADAAMNDSNNKDDELLDDDDHTADHHTDEHDDSDFDLDDLSDSDLGLDDHLTGETTTDPHADEHSGEHTTQETESHPTDTQPQHEPIKTSSPVLTVEEIPLPVIIELGRVQMSIKKLLELQPGNLLELDIHPESGVDLVVNGKRIARGELLRIGEALGVRILELS